MQRGALHRRGGHLTAAAPAPAPAPGPAPAPASASAEEQKAASAEAEAAAAELAKEVAILKAQAEKALAPAGPVIQAAEVALASLSKRSLTDLKSFRSPPKAVVKATSATIILTAGKPKVPKDLSWAAANKMLGNVGKFLDSLLHYDKDNVDEVLVAAVEATFLSDPEFEPEKIRSKSGAAADLCAWCICMCQYSRIYQVVAPIRAALAAANAKLDAANKSLSRSRTKLAQARLRDFEPYEIARIQREFVQSCHGLECVTAGGVQEIKAMAAPPETVKHLMQAVCILFGEPHDHFIEDPFMST